MRWFDHVEKIEKEDWVGEMLAYGGGGCEATQEGVQGRLSRKWLRMI